MRGKLIVIDGVDASGKETQTKGLFEFLRDAGFDITKIEFPNYSDNSSALIKMYLNGDFGENPSDVNPYAASIFYAADRYASYKNFWGKTLDNGGIILSDRYVTSNAIHQAVKLEGQERDNYLEWLNDFEYNKLGLPYPDLVIFLDMPPEYALELLAARYKGDETKKDIHEKDQEYMKRCYESAVFACEKFGWHRVRCVKEGKIRSIEDIGGEVKERVLEVIKS